MKAKVKKIKIPLGGKDEGISEMFNQMLGAGAVNMTIAYPKYLRIKGMCQQLVNLFRMLSDSPFMRKFSEFKPQKDELDAFVTKSNATIAELFSIDFSHYEWNLNLIEDELKESFSAQYDKIKKSDFINGFVIMCDRLVVYKNHFRDLNKLNHKFITCMAGATYQPFPFSSLNLKYIFCLPNVGENTIKFFMTVLNKAYEFSHALWKETVSPDVDVEQFTEVIMANIGEIQKQSKLARCDKAFQKIKDSVHLLKNNFSDYYRDFVTTKDSTVLMQNFIIDVSKKTDSDPQTTRQFRQIINYYRELAQSQIQNPKVKMLFDKVNESFQQLEKGTSNLVNIKKLDDEEETEETEVISADVAMSMDEL
jgi:hypothetical protein